MFASHDLGLRIVWDANAIQHITLKRTWRERLFTLPWRPLQKTKTVQKPSVYFVRHLQTFVAHPALKDAIAQGLAKAGGEGVG